MKATDPAAGAGRSADQISRERAAAPAAATAGAVPGSTQSPIFGEETFFIILSIFIGIFAGLAVVCFRFAIDWSRIVLLGSGMPSTARMLLVPALAGLAISAMVLYIFPKARGSGVNQTKAALYIYNGYIPLRTALGKFITSALAIGSGQSLGPEDPSLQIGASLASALGRRAGLSRDRMRLIAPVGAAAGLAAAFNAPISAVLFVIEEVIGRWTAGILGSVVLSAVSSVVVMRWFLGSEPLFRIPAVQLERPSELPAYCVLGIVGGLFSVVFARCMGYLRRRCSQLPHWTRHVQSALAGLLIGLIAILGAPQVMGAGYEYIDEAMHGQFTWQFLAILAGLKILATTLSYASATPGGMFAPTLFIGAMLGAATGGAAHTVLPYLTTSPGTYALVGMGVLFAGFLRAPMTSVFMALEVSGNYSIILPVIIANTIAYVISRALQPTPIFDLLARQDGIELPSMEEQREEDILRVEDAMRPAGDRVINGAETVSRILQRADNHLPEIMLVRLKPAGWKVVHRSDLEKMLQDGRGNRSLSSLLTGERTPCLHPDQPLETSLRYVHRWKLLPVINRADFRKLEGVVSAQNVLEVYRNLGEEDSSGARQPG